MTKSRARPSTSRDQKIRVSCLGGGTGLFTLLLGLKTLRGLDLSAIVSMSDDGGSTGKLRDALGILPPGDIRRCLVALSTAPNLMNELIQYRFSHGKGLEGHALGNLLLAALSHMQGSMTGAVKALGDILKIQGAVIPVTETSNRLRARLENGKIIEGEHCIDLFKGFDPKLRIRKLWQEPSSKPNSAALKALRKSDFIILGPGDLYTSLISNLIVKGIARAIVQSRAVKIYICNVMTKPGETMNFTASDHVAGIVRYLGKDCLDYVICSSTGFSAKSLKKYARKRQIPVRERSRERLRRLTKAKIIWEDVASEKILVRHDSSKLAGVIQRIIEKHFKR